MGTEGAVIDHVKSSTSRSAGKKRVRKQRVLRLAVSVRQLPLLKRQVMTYLRQDASDGTKYDGNKIEDLILRISCNFATFAGIPPARRMVLLEQALKRYLKHNTSYMSSLCAAWHFTAFLGEELSSENEGLGEATAIRKLMLQSMAEPVAEQKRISAASPGRPPGSRSRSVPSHTTASNEMVEALRDAGCRITRQVKAWLGDAMLSEAQQTICLDRSPDERVHTRDVQEASSHRLGSSTAMPPAEQPLGQNLAPSVARTIPTRMPLSLAPALFRYLGWRAPSMADDCLQWSLIRELVRIDDAQYVYIPERGTARRRGSKRLASVATDACLSPKSSKKSRSRARDDTASSYEQVRLERIREHRILLASLGLGRQSSSTSARLLSAQDASVALVDETGKQKEAHWVPDAGSATEATTASFVSYLIRNEPTIRPWLQRLDPLWIQVAEQVAESCLRRCREAPEPALILLHHSVTARYLRAVQQRNDFAHYRQSVQKICMRYLVEMNSVDNRRKRRFRNRHTSYNEPTLAISSEKIRDDHARHSFEEASGAKEGPPGRACALPGDLYVADALTQPSAAEEVYVWTENDYRQFFAAWRRFGNSVHANKKIAQAMNAAYAANDATNHQYRRGDLKTHDGVSGNVVFLPTHIVYQKRLHRGWLDLHRSDDALKLEQLVPDEHETVCGLCCRGPVTDEQSRCGPLTGPFWEMFSDQPSRPVWIHRQCLLWAPEVFETCEGTMMNVRRAFRRSLRLRCAHCGHKGAATGCFIQSCRRSYHAPECALVAGCSLDEHHYRLLCASHTKMYARALTRGASVFWSSLGADLR
jgi:hypothetical protein